MSRPYLRLSLALFFIVPLTLPGCASVSPEQQQEMTANNDPLEEWNRNAFDNNYFLDRLLLRPAAELYRFTTPLEFRQRISSILANMKEPIIFANDVLQGEFNKAGTTIERFGINTTIGIGGMWDVAGEWNMKQQTGDFGQTLASWGVGEGPYIMLPVIGPSNFRDAFGRGVDTLASPWQWLAFSDGLDTFARFELSDFSATVLSRRERNIETIDDIHKDTLDPYTKMRSAWRQYRHNQIGVEDKQSWAEFEADEETK